MKSYIQRFIFDKLPLRGAFVVLDDVWHTISSQREYPEGIQRFMGELLVANVLLTANLKLKGKVTIQIQDNPKLDLIVSESTHDLTVRATAKFTKAATADCQLKYEDCISSGALVISVDSEADGKLYQSIVALESGIELSDILNEYMLQSEQLKTFFLFTYTKDRVVGFMLQQLPDPANEHDKDLQRLFMMANTMHKSELLTNSITTMLHKLFNEDDIVLFDPQDIKFACTCSRERVTNVLRSLGKEEADMILSDEGVIRITCDFCNMVYIFDAPDVALIFESLCADMDSISKSIH
ncbi:MAG: redox-regulated molecular chaperone Hsp33 [Burkholderiales bacterium]|jgi:molecular chaperone Hsp33|nr:redox-regulated molecular chaperone Hsp33 [Burkholderiales bacterium]